MSVRAAASTFLYRRPRLALALLLGPPLLWLGLGVALLLERYGAMHLQLYSTTNHIVWHTASFGYALIYLGAAGLLYRSLGVYAFPAAMVLGYGGWYGWFCARHSYAEFKLRFWSFERALFIPAIATVVLAAGIAWLWQ